MKVDFRQIEQEDLVLLRDWRNQVEVRKYCREYRLLNMLDQKNWFQKFTTSKLDDMFLVVVDDEPVGVCGLTHINWKDRSSEISYYLGKRKNPSIDVAIGLEVYEFLKKKGFGEYNLNRLWGEAFAFNEGGVKLALLCGFKTEGVMRQVTFWNGEYWDSIIVGMLAEEYYGTKRRTRTK